ncbi:hypothetical protein DP939_12945 [Spongiactinospora rosea]|uniref:GH18 domain-containing protein n=1 Tax=Spongiactinospora rosea TaxID=2248750 RepID=A0A366M2I5_9ACTN|nr:hypothetical protein [Spongiactinospora rosea]RBQ19642.1 hypothetical protein DP939_12945 [Spongiactinospora rosea]
MRERLPGTPPRPVVALAFVLLFATTGAVLALLPGPRAAAGLGPFGAGGLPVTSAAEVTGMERPRRLVVQPIRTGPEGFVVFVDTARYPGLGLSAVMRRSGARWFALGHLTTGGADRCLPRWGGVRDLGDAPVADALARVRALGGDAAPSLGGPGGPEPALTCPRVADLTAAYRRVVDTLDATHLDFEIDGGDDEDGKVAARRARALAALKREAAGAGRRLTVGFSLRLTATGLSAADQRLLAASGPVDTVDLLVPFRPRPGGEHLRALAASIRLAQAQIATAFGLPAGEDAWRRIGLTPVLRETADLTLMDARKLAGYARRRDLAWLSVRGARPALDVARVLAHALR